MATLARSSSRILDLVQALRADGSIPTVDPEIEDGVSTSAGYQNLFDIARLDLVEYFESHTKSLLTDNDASVRRAFLGSVAELCVFFGSSRASDVVLSHLNTYLNDRDWILKCSFFQTVVGVATFIGGTGLEDFILPVMVQALTDPEEFVVEQVLSSFASMAELGLFQRSKVWEIVDVIARFLVHPNIWIREAAAYFISASTKFLSLADVHCMISPLVQPYLKFFIADFSETFILNALRKPLPRNVMELAMAWATQCHTSLFWKPAQEQRTFSFGSPDQTLPIISSKDLRLNTFSKIPKNEEDEQWLNRLRNVGMVQDDETKLIALREYIWHMAPKRTTDGPSEAPTPGGIRELGKLGITPQTVFFETRRRRTKTHHRPASAGRGFEERSRLPSSGPHTIADALLEATTTIDDPLSERKRSFANARRERLSGDSTVHPSQPQSNIDRSKPSIPDHHAESEGDAAPKTTIERKASPRIPSPGSSFTEEQKSDGTLTPSEAHSRAERGRGIKHKSSAIDLLRRKDTIKTTAETATTPTNAFGQVDGLHRTEGSVAKSQSAKPQASDQQQGTQNEIRTTHTYDGNDPNILQLLTSLASRNYSQDIVDFGPFVTPIHRTSLVKKAGPRESDKPWRPEGTLVATFGEHTAPINRVVPSPDHAFFVTASDDGCVKIWDALRLERNLASRSRQTYRHADGAKVKCITFIKDTHTFISGGTDGSVHAVRVEYRRAGDVSRYGKVRKLRDYQLPKDEYAVDLKHFRAEAHSVLMMATNKSRVIALDMRDMTQLYVLENPVHHGTPTCFCVDFKQHWIIVGTSHGVLDFWDIRWKLRLRSWGLSGGAPIHCIRIHPFHGKGKWICVGGGTGHTDFTVWDLETGECKEIYRAGATRSTTKGELKMYEAWRVDEEKPENMLSRFAASVEPAGMGNLDRGIRAMALGLDMSEDGKEAKTGFFLTGGSDKKLRFWDGGRIEISKVLSGLDVDEDQPKYSTSHPTTSLSIFNENNLRPGPSAPNAAAGNKPPANTAAKKASPKPPRSTVISQQQQYLLKNHLDTIMDVAILESPVGMVVSVDRSGIIKVFQ